MKAKPIRYNAVMSVLLTSSNMIVGFISVPYVTRVLSVDGYGDVSFAQSISTWLSSLCLLGVSTYGIRECAKVRDDRQELSRVVKELFCIVTAATAAVLGAFAIAIMFVPKLASLAPLMWLFLISTLLLSYGVEWFYQAIEQYEYITVRSVFFKVISLIAIFMFVRDEGDSLIYGAILALGVSANNLINLARLFKLVDFRTTGQINPIRHLKPLAPFAILGIASAAYNSVDMTILGFVSETNYQVGLYQLVAKLKNVSFSVINAVLVVLIPRLSYLVAQKQGEEYQTLLRKALAFVLNVTVFLLGVFWVFADPIVCVVASGSYLAAVPALKVTGIVNMLSCFGYFVGYCVLMPLGREGVLSRANVYGVGVSIALNLVLDAPLGALGASISMLCAELVIVLVNVKSAKQELKQAFDLRGFVRCFLVNALASFMSVVLLSCFAGEGNVLAAIVIGFLHFLVVLGGLAVSGEPIVVEQLKRFLTRGGQRSR